MLRYVFVGLSLLWLSLILLLGAMLWIAPHLPSKGTLLLTHNVFLNEYDRFEFYDISRGLLYGFTPDLNEDVVSASVAPNGRYIAYIAFDDDRAKLTIATLSEQALSETINTQRLRLGSWSLNSRYFVQEDGTSTLSIMDIATSAISQIRIQDTELSMPSWSNDNEHLVFIGLNDESFYQIWTADSDGDNLHQVLNTENVIRCPILSPDGETIAYLERAENGNQLHYVGLDDSSNRSYQSGIWRTTHCPLWSADGRYITFIAFLSEEYTTDIVLLDALTGETEVLLEVDPTTNIQWWR